MKKPWLKKVRSYFREIILEETSSRYNPVLQVILTEGRYQLCTKTAIYSFEDKYDNYRKAFHYIDIKKRNPQNILLLGMGLGSIPFMIEKLFGVMTNYTAVEIDEEICRLAEKYTFSELQSAIEVFPVDANLYLDLYHDTFDIIAMDIFQSSVIPPEFETNKFFEKLQRKLKPNGLILYNRLADSDKNLKLNKNFWKRWKDYFPDAEQLNTGTNVIYFNTSIDTV